MLKEILESLEGLDAKYHALYTKGEDGKYHLDSALIIDNTQNVDGLKNNNAALKAEKLALQAKLDALSAAEAEGNEAGLKAEKKYDELLALKSEQADEKISKATARAEQAETILKQTMIDGAVASLSLKLAGDSAPLLTPHLRNRFQVNEVEGKYVLQITDVNGVTSNLTADQLGEEIKANKLYAPLLQGRQSSGGGSGGGAGGGGGDSSDYDKYFKPDSPDYNSEKQYELEKKDKAAHDRLVKKYSLDDPFAIA